MSQYIVTGPTAVVVIKGKRRYLGQGVPVPDGVEKSRLEHLLGVGLIAPAKSEEGKEAELSEPAVGDSVPSDDPLEDLTVDQLRELAAERGYDLGGATRKPEIKAAIVAAQAAE